MEELGRKEQTMITLTMSDEEALLLQGIIKSYFDETRVEIRHTDSREYRGELVRQEEIVRRLLQELDAAGAKKVAV
jgi:hypothetical protein